VTIAGLPAWRACADLVGMEIDAQAQAALSMLTMTVQGAHDAMQRAQSASGSAPTADVILELSAAAKSLITPASS
jgi:hypothetical protein